MQIKHIKGTLERMTPHTGDYSEGVKAGINYCLKIIEGQKAEIEEQRKPEPEIKPKGKNKK
jgi:uncharacterized membrane protein YgcG